MIANRVYDCVVLGAGPAGCTAAALVAEQGFATLLIERDKVPRFHVGESLMPESYWIFERLGILHEMDRVGFVKKNGVQFVSASDKESKPFIFRDFDDRDCSDSWHVKRDEFDHLLYETAYNRGATCVDETRILDIDIRKKSPHLITVKNAAGKEQDISARVVVDASGQQTLIANRLSLKEYYPDLKKAAIWGYFEGAECLGAGKPEVTCILHTESKEAWFWYIPLHDGTVSVGLVGDNDFLLKRGGSPQQTFESEMKNCPGIQRRLRDATQAGRFHIAKEFSYTTQQQTGDGWVLIGDAAGFIDPIYSSGVYLALKSAVMASECITEGLHRNDVSGETLGRWTGHYEEGVNWIRKLVRTFYTNEFSFAKFIKSHPEHAANLTNLLIGRVFEGTPGKMFDDLDPWLEKIKAGEPVPEPSA